MSTERLLAERQSTHGEYAEHAAATQSIMDVLRSHRNWSVLPPMVRETLHMIAHKMGRIVTGDPCHQDHYDDIAGYATLISQRLGTIIGQVQRLRDQQREVYVPGTPEDGGHHARQQED